MNRRQYSFDNSDVDPKEEDEFMTYYRKFRPSMASSSQSLSQASSSSPSFSQLSDYQGRLNHHGTSSGGSVKSSEGGGGGSIFKRKWYQTKKRIQQLPKSRSMEERSSSIRTPSRHHPPGHPHLQTSPLGGLTGMLSDKMTFSSSNSASTSLGHQSGSEGEVDSQSRDSGHSSGGSPDLRGLRKRRSAPPQPLMNYGREWYHQRQNALAGGYSQDDGGNSIYSYETARTMHPVPLSRTQHDFRPQLHHQQQWDENSIYSNDATRDGGRSSTYYDSYSEPFPEERLDSWSPDLTTVHKRKLDELREDVTFSGNGVCASPRRKKPFDTRREYNPSSRAPDFPPAKPAAPTGASVSLICSRLCLIFKTVLMTVSCCLLLFGMFFIWRSFRCESDRHKAFDIPELTKTFEENVFGQHIAKEEITKDLIRFFEGNESVLVMVLVGWLGGGKTFTTSLIKDHFPIPENVHSFAVPLHFAMETDNFHFLDDLALHIGRSCGHSMVIFDDIDSGSPKALAQVEKFVLNLRSSQLSSRSNGTLVLITSNAGGKVLNTHALNVMKERHSKRDEITYETCSDLLAEVEVPCYKSISKQDIPIRVIPFLPLTRDHVRQCVRRQTSSRGLSASEKEIERVVKDVSFFSEESPWLSKTGCKQIAGKVDLHIGAEDNPYIEDE